MNVLIADKLEQSGLDGLRALGCNVVSDPGLTPETLADAANRAEADVLIVRSKKVPAPAVSALTTVRGIIRAGAGYDNIDLAAASAAEIAVCNCPGMNAVAVAELAIGHLICCDRRIPEQTAVLKAGKWNKKGYGAGCRGLKGSTLGVVGLGAIGREVIARARAFEMNVIAWSRSLTESAARDLGAGFGGNDRAGLLAMLPRCDAVTVHVAGNEETKRLCDGAFFGAMKRGAIFVNTARGSVVDDAALRSAIQARGIRAGLDVYEGQPGTPEAEFDSETAKLPGVCSATHHCGASTDQAQEAVAAETVRIVHVFRDEGRWINCVNEAALRKS